MGNWIVTVLERLNSLAEKANGPLVIFGLCLAIALLTNLVVVWSVVLK